MTTGADPYSGGLAIGGSAVSWQVRLAVLKAAKLDV
jgi:hypothetical protein